MVRYPQQPRPVAPLTVTPPLKVLVMISNPSDVAILDVEKEWNKVVAALEPLVGQGLVQLSRLEAATLFDLQRRLRLERYHIFHFVGHGGIDRRSGERVLYLEDEQGVSHPVSGSYLGTLLCDHPTLRLVLLNACEGARGETKDPFAGIAQHLAHQGIPAIIAMQFEITDQAAITLAQEFYAALADGYPVEAALAEARKAIFVMGNDVEWGTPVLYSRANDGFLFRVEPLLSRPGRDTSDAELSRKPIASSQKMIDIPTAQVEPAQIVAAVEHWANREETLEKPAVSDEERTAAETTTAERALNKLSLAEKPTQAGKGY
ncbi:MAG: CHAT domain-containing protein [Caldilineaceae bacterium]